MSTPSVRGGRYVVTDEGRAALVELARCDCPLLQLDGIFWVCPDCGTCWSRFDYTRGRDIARSAGKARS